MFDIAYHLLMLFLPDLLILAAIVGFGVGSLLTMNN